MLSAQLFFQEVGWDICLKLTTAETDSNVDRKYLNHQEPARRSQPITWKDAPGPRCEPRALTAADPEKIAPPSIPICHSF